MTGCGSYDALQDSCQLASWAISWLFANYRPVMVATATEMCEPEGAAWLIITVCVPIVLYVIWASSFVQWLAAPEW